MPVGWPREGTRTIARCAAAAGLFFWPRPGRFAVVTITLGLFLRHAHTGCIAQYRTVLQSCSYRGTSRPNGPLHYENRIERTWFGRGRVSAGPYCAAVASGARRGRPSGSLGPVLSLVGGERGHVDGAFRFVGSARFWWTAWARTRVGARVENGTGPRHQQYERQTGADSGGVTARGSLAAVRSRDAMHMQPSEGGNRQGTHTAPRLL